MAHTCNPSFGGKRSRVQCQLQIHSKFETRVVYMRPCFRKQAQTNLTITTTKHSTLMLYCQLFSVSHQCGWVISSSFSFPCLPFHLCWPRVSTCPVSVYVASKASALCVDLKPINDIFLRLLCPSKFSNDHSARCIFLSCQFPGSNPSFPLILGPFI